MLWELIQSEWERAKGLEAAAPVEETDVLDSIFDKEEPTESDAEAETPEEEVEQTDVELLKELEDL